MTPSWKAAGAAYLPDLAAAEDRFAIPTDLLARVAYQECSWRADVISGEVKSPAGAVGMMQLMPQFFPGAGVDWHADIVTAGRYLSQLHQQFNDWTLAVAAYNWGPTALQRWLGQGGINVSPLPAETSNYVAEVFTDVPVTGELA